MSTNERGVQSAGRYVHANGTDIYYVEAGQGEPLILLHGGMVSTNPIWTGVLAVLPNHGHFILPSAVQVTIEFLERHLGGRPASSSAG